MTDIEKFAEVFAGSISGLWYFPGGHTVLAAEAVTEYGCNPNSGWVGKALVDLALTTPDQYIEADVIVTPTNNDTPGLVLKSKASPAQAIQADFRAADITVVGINLGTTVVPYTPPATPFKARLESVGGRIRVYADGVLIVDEFDVVSDESGHGGVYLYTGGLYLARIDNVKLGELVSAKPRSFGTIIG